MGREDDPEKDVESAAPGANEALPVFDLIARLRRTLGDFAPREQRVASHVLQNLEAVSRMAISDLSEACNVSNPTVVRFCRTLGYDGFRDFKIDLARNVAVSMQYVAPPPSGRLGDSPLDLVIGSLAGVFGILRDQLDPVVFHAIAARLRISRQIVFAGIGGGSSMVAQDAANRFSRLGIPATHVCDSYMMQICAATLKATDTLFLISVSGEASEIVKATETANHCGVVTICLTRSGSTLAGIASLALAFDLPESVAINMPTTMRHAHLILTDALAGAVAEADPVQTREAVRRAFAALTAYHGRVGPSPLDD